MAKVFILNSNASKDLATAKKKADDFAKQLKNTDPDDKMYSVIKGAAESSDKTAKELEERFNKMISLVNSGKILAWQIIQIALYEDDKVADVFKWQDAQATFKTYDELLKALHVYLTKHFTETTVKGDTLTSGDYFITGEPDAYKRFYMVSEVTDLGHNWKIPLLRCRLKDDDDFFEFYANPILK